jgi:hypothetical protein
LWHKPRIIEVSLARSVHDWLAQGVPAREAAQRAVELVASRGEIGIIVLGPAEMAAAANQPFAWAGRQTGGPWQGAWPDAASAP